MFRACHQNSSRINSSRGRKLIASKVEFKGPGSIYIAGVYSAKLWGKKDVYVMVPSFQER